MANWPYSRVTDTSMAALATVVPRTGGQATQSAFNAAVALDIATLTDQLNSVYYELARTLAQEDSIDAVQFGLSGNSLYTHIDATVGSGSVYWNSTNLRGNTVKETVDVLLTEINRLEGLIQQQATVSAYDDTAVLAGLAVLSNDVTQIVEDAFGGDYAIHTPAAANMEYSLARHILAILQIFTNGPTAGFGVTFGVDAYPTLQIDTSVLSGGWAFETAANVTSNVAKGTIGTDDFVFGSATLAYFGIGAQASRMFFDKSQGAFRAGYDALNSWNDASTIGQYSFGWGWSGSATGVRSSTGGRSCTAASEGSISWGYSNLIGALATQAICFAGMSNVISTGDNSTTFGHSHYSVILDGQSNRIGNTSTVSDYCGIYNSNSCTVATLNSGNHSYSTIIGSVSSTIGTAFVSSHCSIVGSDTCVIGTTVASIGTTVASIGSSIIGALNSSINGDYSFIGGGVGNSITGSVGFIGGGSSNTITAANGGVVFGANCTLAADYSIARGLGHTIASAAQCGEASGAYAAIAQYGEKAQAAGKFSVIGDAQTGSVILRKITTDATPAIMLLGDGSEFALLNDSTYLLEISIVARCTDVDDKSAGWTITAVMDRNGTALTTALVGTEIKTMVAKDTAGVDVAITADGTHGGPTLTVTGVAGSTYQWVAHLRYTRTVG